MEKTKRGKFQFNICGQEFKSKKALTEKIREILYGNEELSIINQEFMKEVLQLHPEYEQKKGTGIDYIYIDKDGYNGKCFWIQRLDGTTTDFSFYSCINGEPSHRAQFLKSCRYAVKQDTQNKKQELYNENPVCAVSGVSLIGRQVHLDHAYPLEFQTIVQNFIDKHNLDINKVKIKPMEDGNTITEFEDERFARAFRKYHNSVAQLRLVDAKINMSDLRKKR